VVEEVDGEAAVVRFGHGPQYPETQRAGPLRAPDPFSRGRAKRQLRVSLTNSAFAFAGVPPVGAELDEREPRVTGREARQPGAVYRIATIATIEPSVNASAD
jgi:hypothetical protein